MFRNYYYYFIAGLHDIFFDDSEVHFPMLDFKNELEEHLHPADYKLAELLFLPYDNQNLLLYLNENYNSFNKLGKFSVQDFETEFSDDRAGILPTYMYDFVALYHDEEFVAKNLKSWENLLTEMYIGFVTKTKNGFLKSWFRFSQDLNNLVIGYNCRKHNISAEKQLVGDNLVTRAVLNSNAKDFGLETDIPYIPEVASLIENSSLHAREKGLDMLRWKMIDDLVLFEYFTIDVILAYTIKLDIVYRWLELNEETGRQMLDKIMSELKSGFEFPKEFAINGKKK